MKKRISVDVILIIVLTIMTGVRVIAAENDKIISIADFTRKLEKVSGVENGSLYEKNEFQTTKKGITNGEAAILVDRADEQINGKHYNKKIYEQVIKKKRITGLKGVGTKKKEAIYRCFVKGIMPGESNGAYTQNRNFNTNKYLTRKEADKILERLLNKKKRTRLSPDGQVIRTNNLPRNYKSFSYILESFPNKFYEKKFEYQKVKWGKKPVHLKDYASPKSLRKFKAQTFSRSYDMGEILDQYQDEWIKKVEDNLRLRLSFDYQKVNNKWIEDLRKTYIIYNRKELDKDRPKNIRDYVKIAKNNKVKLKVKQVIVEPSTMYEEAGFWVRAHVKFKLVSAKSFYNVASGRQRNIIYGNYISLDRWKKNKWYEGDFDLQLTGSNLNDCGYGYAVSEDCLSDWEEKN